MATRMQLLRNVDLKLILKTFIIVPTALYLVVADKISPVVLNADHIKAAMLGHQIIPDVLKQAPRNLFQMYFIDGFTPKLGNVLAPEVMRFSPTFLRWPEENMIEFNNTLYTLLMIDPDMPSRNQSTLGQWVHWLISNINGTDPETGDLMAPYLPPEPEKDTGYHRITFMIFKQAGRINFTEPWLTNDRNDTHRTRFSTEKFAAENKLGLPTAINFCLTAFNRSSIDGFEDSTRKSKKKKK